MIDLEAARDTLLVGTGLGVLGLFTFLANPRAEPGFRLAPQSAGEWLAYYFHTLSFILVSALVGLVLRAGDFALIALACWMMLLLSSVVFWRYDRALCKGALMCCFVSVALALLLSPLDL